MKGVRRVLLTLLFLSFSFAISAQEIRVTSIKKMLTDLEAQQQPRYDINQVKCALVKVHVPGVEGLKFIGNVVDSVYEAGVYKIYITAETKKIKYQHPDYLPGEIVLSGEDFNMAESERVYLVVLEPDKIVNAKELEEKNASLQKDLAEEKKERQRLQDEKDRKERKKDNFFHIGGEHGRVGLCSRFTSGSISPSSLGLNVDIVAENFYFGAGFGFGLGTSSTLNWQSIYTNTHRLSIDPKYVMAYKEIGEMNPRVGYPMQLGNFFIVPTIGLRLVFAQGQTVEPVGGKDYYQSFTLPTIPIGVRFQYMSPFGLGVTVGPEYQLSLMKGEIWQTVSAASGCLAGLVSGFNLNVSLEFCFDM